MTRSSTPNTTVAYTRNYAYDKLGNIQQIQQVGINAFTRTYNYIPNTNKLSGVTIGANAYSFTYDNCANQQTENVNRKFDWDAADRLLFFRDQVGTSEPTVEAQYMYDAGGQRIKKIVRKQGGLFEIRVYIDGVFEYFTDEVDTQNTVHIMDNQSRVATVRIGAAIGDPTPPIKYELSDVIGSSMVLLDTTGAEVNSQEYYPFGETSFGSYAKKRYQYVNKERDNESGLYYYGARYYAAWTCRFISVDPLAARYAHLTPYNYADNNPINDYDIDGMQNNNSGKTPQNGGGSGGGGGGNNNTVKPITNNIQLQQDNTKANTITPDPGALQAMKDMAAGTYEMKQAIKKNNEAVKQSSEAHAKEQILGKKDPQFWLNKGNPEMANYVATQKTMGEQSSAFMKFSVWFNGIGSPMIANFGVGEKTTTEPKIVTEFVNFGRLKMAPNQNYNFFTVQNSSDAARLSTTGSPWPTGSTRAHLGPGVYSWDNKADATKYFSILQGQGVSDLKIMQFSVKSSIFEGLNSFNVNKMTDKQATDFMKSNSLLWGGSPNHNYDLIIRGTSIGNEYFFNSSTYPHLKFH